MENTHSTRYILPAGERIQPAVIPRLSRSDACPDGQIAAEMNGSLIALTNVSATMTPTPGMVISCRICASVAGHRPQTLLAYSFIVALR
jgi:hypothetical protein